MKYTMILSDEGLKRQFGKVPTAVEMADIITKALTEYVFEQQMLNDGTFPKLKIHTKQLRTTKSVLLQKKQLKSHKKQRLS